MRIHEYNYQMRMVASYFLKKPGTGSSRQHIEVSELLLRITGVFDLQGSRSPNDTGENRLDIFNSNDVPINLNRTENMTICTTEKENLVHNSARPCLF